MSIIPGPQVDKLSFSELARKNHLPVPFVFKDFHDAFDALRLKGIKCIARSNHRIPGIPYEPSGLAESLIMAPHTIASFDPDFAPLYQPWQDLVSNGDSSAALAFLDSEQNWADMHTFTILSGIDPGIIETGYVFQEYIPGTGITYVQDNVLPQRGHLSVRANGEHSQFVIDFQKDSTPHIFPLVGSTVPEDVLYQLPSIREMDEQIRMLYGNSLVHINEYVVRRDGKLFVLQTLPCQPFFQEIQHTQPATGPLCEATFVRGGACQTGIEIITSAPFLNLAGLTPEDYHAITTQFPKVKGSAIPLQNKAVREWLLHNAGDVYISLGVNGKLDAHAVNSLLHKPRVTALVKTSSWQQLLNDKPPSEKHEYQIVLPSDPDEPWPIETAIISVNSDGSHAVIT